MDFEIHGSIDPVRIFDSNSLGSYHMFLQKNEKEYRVHFDEHQENVLEFISKKFAPGKRPHELILLKLLLENAGNVLPLFKCEMMAEYGIQVTQRTLVNVINILTNNFATGSGKMTYKDCVLMTSSGEISDSFREMLQDDAFHDEIKELVEYGLYRFKQYYSDRYQNTSFQLYSKYTYEDVCRLLEWEKGEVALNIGGYKYDKITQTYPVFINYDKAENIADTVRYEDRLTSPFSLIAISKSGRSLESEDVKAAVHADELGIEMHLFVRKNKGDKISKEFYYLGKIHATGETKVFIMPNTTKTAVEISYQLETPVRDDLYDYLTAN